MRLAILDHGHGFGTKALFALIRALSRQPVLDIIKLSRYRADFYGGPMQKVTQEAMRGPSVWSVGDRELMAAVIAQANECEWCTKAHPPWRGLHIATPRGSLQRSRILEGARIDEPLRATLRMLRKLTRERTVDAEDMRAVLSAGASRAHIVDALAVSFAFGTVNRLADAFGFSVPGPDAFAAGAKFLLARGYR